MKDGCRTGYVEIRLRDERFAVPLEMVREIVRRPPITSVPGSPPTIRGLMNLRDTLIPVLDLADRLGLGTPGEEKEILVVEVEGFRFGLLIGEAAQVATLEGTVQEQDGNRFGGLVSRVLHSGERLLPLLDPVALVGQDLERIRRICGTGHKAQSQEGDRRQDWHSVVVFDLQGTDYALPLGSVREILHYAEPYRIPETAPHVRGVLSVRGSVVPVVDPALKLGLPPRDQVPPTARIVLVEYGTGRAGLVVDAIREVLEFPASDLKAPPPLLRQRDGSSTVLGVAEVKGRLIGLLDKGTLVGEEDLKLFDEEGTASRHEVGEAPRKEQTCIVFEVDHRWFGLPLERVREITRLGPISPVPGTPPYVEGTMSLRGEVLTVVSLRRRFGLPQGEDDGRRRLLVADSREGDQGIRAYLVDGVVGVENVPLDRVRPLAQTEEAPPEEPGLPAPAERFLSGAVTLEGGRILQLLDPLAL